MTIPGRPPALDNPPEGCRFHLRCPIATTQCQKIEPQLVLKRDNVEKIISKLFKYFYISPNKLPLDWRKIDEPIERIICDYISGMTDRYASRLFKGIYE